MTPLQRSNMPGNQDFSVNARNELECNLCGKVVDHTRQDSVDKHKDTDMHIRNKANPPTMVQQSLFTTMPIKTTARLANAIVVCDWIRSCAAANIPLNASNNPQLRHFFRNHVKIGGAIPKSNGLQLYLEDCYLSDRQKLIDEISGKKVIIFYDETSDSEGRFVSSILIATLPLAGTSIKPLLAEMLFDTTPLNYGKVARYVVKFLNDFKIAFEDVVGYATDNASYMIASFTNSLQTLLPNCTHLTCISHTLNLVTKDFMASFVNVRSWCTEFSSYIRRSGARKYRYKKFLEDIGYSQQLPPQPVSTRWTSMFDAIVYHAEFLPYEKSFLLTETDNDDAEDLRNTLAEDYKFILAEARFIKNRVNHLIIGLKIFESDLGLGCLTRDYLERLEAELTVQSNMPDDSLEEILDLLTETFTRDEKRRLLEIIQVGTKNALSKFCKYFGESGCHPALELLRQVQYFNPNRSLTFTAKPDLVKDVPDSELVMYQNLARQFTGTLDPQKVTDKVQAITDFWIGNQENLPNLSKIALVYGFLVCSSASVERCFSKYDKLLSEDRKSLSPDSIKHLMFIYFNSGKLE